MQPKIVFMGTPLFAAAAMEHLIYLGDQNIIAVYTQPDRPSGRGMETKPSAAKEYAQTQGIPVFECEDMGSEEVRRQIEALEPDLIVVVAFGQILPESILRIPRLGAINLHASLLPKYRGASPVQWAVLNGDKVTGVSIMYLAKELDTGDVICQEEVEIDETETAEQLCRKLMVVGGELLVDAVDEISSGTAQRTPQDHSKATYTRKLDKSLSPIDWDRSPRQVMKWICGLQPWPVATMELEGQTVRVFAAEYSDTRCDKAPGTIVSAGEQGIEVACAKGETIRITQLQAPGKKRMSAADYLRGHPLKVQ